MKTERETIEAAQDALGELKGHMRALQKINTERGDLVAANAVMGLRGDLMRWHSNATVALNESFPEFASEIQTRGGGGGR